MKLSTILKGCLGLALIYLVCLPICALGKVVGTIETNKSAELNQKVEVEKVSKMVKKVEFSPVERLRFLPPEESEEDAGKFFIDGYFKNEKLLEKKVG